MLDKIYRLIYSLTFFYTYTFIPLILIICKLDFSSSLFANILYQIVEITGFTMESNSASASASAPFTTNSWSFRLYYYCYIKNGKKIAPVL